MHSDWFFLGRDFAIWTISMETVLSSVFLFSKAGKFNLCNQNYEKKNIFSTVILTSHSSYSLSPLGVAMRSSQLPIGSFYLF